MPHGEGAATGQVGNPLTAAHEGEPALGIDPLLASEDASRHAAPQLRTLEASPGKSITAQQQMTHTGEGPLVVHRPHHRLAAPENAAHVGERQETLAHPVNHHHVCLAKLRPAGDVHTRVGQAHLPQSTPAQPVAKQDAEAFPRLAPQPGPDARHAWVVRLPVAHQHASIHAAPAEGFHQTPGRDGRAARAFACA